MAVGRRIVASWMWAVINPQVEHCEYEEELLARTLTFRPHNRDFERLLPLRRALMPEGREIYEDLYGENLDYAAIVQSHDQALDELRRQATTLFEMLLQSQDFTSLVERIAEPGQSEASRADATRYLASYVVNDLHADLDHSVYADLWSSHAAELSRLASPPAAQSLRDQRTRFVQVVREVRGKLVALRKGWSRQYDIPVAPVPGISLEAPRD